MYKALIDFDDKNGGGGIYRAGDVYPAEGSRPAAERIEHLLSPNAWQGKPVIVELPQDDTALDAALRDLADDEPTMDWSVADLRAYANEHGIALGRGVTSKEAILNAIQEAGGA